jgi:hypothetical protein
MARTKIRKMKNEKALEYTKGDHLSKLRPYPPGVAHQHHHVCDRPAGSFPCSPHRCPKLNFQTPPSPDTHKSLAHARQQGAAQPLDSSVHDGISSHFDWDLSLSFAPLCFSTVKATDMMEKETTVDALDVKLVGDIVALGEERIRDPQCKQHAFHTIIPLG